MQEPPASQEITRRSFLEYVVGLIGAVIAAALAVPLVGYLISPAFRRSQRNEWSQAAARSDLTRGGNPLQVLLSIQETDSWVKKQVTQRIFLVEDGTIIALSSVCTHLGCGVAWNPQTKHFECPCHGGKYDRQGRVIAGPPPRPLPRYEVKVEGGKVFVR